MRYVFNYDDAKAETGKQMKDVWRGTSPLAEEKALGKHPTMKPQWILDRIIEISTEPGAVILDPFCGSGSAGVSALRLARAFVGIDLDDEYHELALRRLAAAGATGV